MTLTINLLGQPEIVQDGALLDINRRKSRALLYYVAAHAAPVQREQILLILWPDLDRPAALQSLRTTLYGVRRVLGDHFLADDERLALADEVEVDVRTFVGALNPPIADPAQLAATLDLYRGDFLSGFSVDGAPDFDDWLVAQSEYYRRLALRGLVALAQHHEDHQAYTAALDVADRALALDPLQEDIQRTALRLHYLAGDRAGAIRRYDQLRRLLDEELGVPPMAETRALYDAILDDALPKLASSPALPIQPAPSPQAPAPHPVAPQPPTNAHMDLLPFTGRAAELAQLRLLPNHPTQRFALITGEPGIGKTRLAREFLATSNTLALTGSARELEHNLPYQPIIEALRSLFAHPAWTELHPHLARTLPPVWLAETARLLPELLSDPPPLSTPDEARLWEGVHQFLRTLAQHHPLSLFIDDLHWADSSTLALLGYLIRQSRPAPITYIATARTVETGSALQTLVQTLTRTGELLNLPLARLPRDAITQIAQALSQAYTYPLADWLAQSSEGNPFVMAELVRHARAQGLIQADGQLNLSALTSSELVPHSIYSLIQARLTALSDAARRVLDVAVAVGRVFDFDVVYRAAELSEQAAFAALDELQNAFIVRPIDNGLHFQFDHPLTLEVAYREVGEARHRLLHHHVAQTLETLHGREADFAGLIAWHFQEGNDPQRAAPFAYRAGRHAASLAAWAEAIPFFEQALAVPGASIPRFAALMALGNAYLNAGQLPRATTTLEQALAAAQADPEAGDECAARLAYGESLLPQARFAEAIALIEQFPEPDDAPSALAAVHAEQLWGTALSLEGADLSGAAQHLESAKQRLAALRENYPDAPPDPLNAANLDFELGSVAAQQGDLPRAIELYHTALETAEKSTNPDAAMRIILAHNNLAYHLHLLNDPAALTHAEAGLALANETGMRALLSYLYSTRGEIALAAGELDTAQTYFEQGLALAAQTHNQERVAGLTANLGLIARERGDQDRAVDLLRTARDQADDLGTLHLAAQIRLWLAPLLPREAGRATLAEARHMAETGRRQRLLAEAVELEQLLAEDR